MQKITLDLILFNFQFSFFFHSSLNIVFVIIFNQESCTTRRETGNRSEWEGGN